MAFSTYAITVPVFSRAIINLISVLGKAEAWAADRKIDPAVLVQARLAPDMLPLSFQVQSVTDRPKFLLSRLTGRDAPSWPDDEKSFEDLRSRLRKGLDYINSFSEADLEGAENTDVVLRIGGQEVSVPGAAYIFERQMPNFWFHLTTAYDILRNQGVPLSKSDFIG